MKKLNNKGFSAVEVVIVIVVIVLLGLVGWLVYGRQKTKSTVQPVSQSTEQVNKKENDTELPKNEIKQTDYFEIKELGVKFKPIGSLSGLYYSMDNNNNTAYFSLNSFKNTDCAAEKTSQAALTRYTNADFASVLPAYKEGAKKIGDYYFIIVGAQSICSENDAIQKQATQLRTDILKLLPGALIPL